MNPAPLVKNGYLDLSSWDFEKDGNITLEGNWEFYWNQLLIRDNFKSGNAPEFDAYVKVPHSWNNTVIKGNKISGIGCATYKLHVKLNKQEKALALKLRDASSAYAIYADYNLIASAGNVSCDASLMEPELKTQTAIFNINASEFDLLVQVSNNFHHEGGLWENMQLGTTSNIIKARENALIKEIFIVGAVAILCLFHFFTFFMRRSDKALLWFAILCFSIFFFLLFRGERIIYLWFPNLSPTLGYKLEYLLIFMNPIALTGYLSIVFSKDFPVNMKRIIYGTCALIFIIIIVTPTSTYSSFMLWFRMVMIALALCLCVIAALSLIRKRRLAVFFLAGLIIILLAVTNDVLYAQKLLNTKPMASFAFVVFLLSQAYLIAKHYYHGYSEMANELKSFQNKQINES